ncbi:unnamed protein product [Caenorhabditis auriculariae]|uniref:Reverse transcriptase domain-containing protein n=1 Tax=Caenorhabditis auriculariae TaxID=2777116 RepID=A0A8S1HA04_9PELO|nr:unnamed protein product [Caenorhabditis auriculariae]
MRPSFNVGSDHRIVRAKIRLNRKVMKRNLHQPPRPKRPTYDATTLERNIYDYPWRSHEDPTEDYKLLCEGLLKCAEPATRPSSTLPPRLDQRAKDLLKKRGEIKRDPSSTHLDQLLIDKACRMAVEESLRNRRKQALLQAAEKRQSIRKKKFELTNLHSVMTGLKDANGQLKTSRRDMENITVDFYTELFKSNTTVARTLSPTPEDEPAILAEEVVYAIRKLKIGTSAGPDNITTELLKSGGDALNNLLAKHFSTYLKEASIPVQWKISKTILIPKKGDVSDLNNFRPISLLSVVYKLFTKVILNRLEKKLDDFQPASQARFRRNFCCMDHIHTLTQVVERHREYKLPLAIAFVDYKKAFDSVEVNAIRNSLVSAGIATKYVDLISDCNEGTSTTIRQEAHNSHWKRSTARRHHLSETILHSLGRRDAGININGKVLTNLRFADDIVIFANNTADLSTMLNDLNDVGKKIGLTMNQKKTQWMCNSFCDNGPVTLEGDNLQKVDSYVYLGREVNMLNER